MPADEDRRLHPGAVMRRGSSRSRGRLERAFHHVLFLVDSRFRGNDGVPHGEDSGHAGRYSRHSLGARESIAEAPRAAADASLLAVADSLFVTVGDPAGVG